MKLISTSPAILIRQELHGGGILLNKELLTCYRWSMSRLKGAGCAVQGVFLFRRITHIRTPSCLLSYIFLSNLVHITNCSIADKLLRMNLNNERGNNS